LKPFTRLIVIVICTLVLNDTGTYQAKLPYRQPKTAWMSSNSLTSRHKRWHNIDQLTLPSTSDRLHVTSPEETTGQVHKQY